MRSFEQYLNEEGNLEDFDRLTDALNDSLLTNNVLKYVDGYLKEYKQDIINKSAVLENWTVLSRSPEREDLLISTIVPAESFDLAFEWFREKWGAEIVAIIKT